MAHSGVSHHAGTRLSHDSGSVLGHMIRKDRFSRQILGFLVTTTAIVLIATGCGGGGDSAPATESTPAAADAPPGEATPATESRKTAPATAFVSIQDDRIPVDPPETLPARVDMIAATGAKLARIDVFWRDIATTEPANPTDPTDPAYDFARYDTVVEGLADKGVRTMLSVYNSPDWSAGGFTQGITPVVNAQAPDPEDFGNFMKALATRYSGEFAANGATLPEVHHFEVWNEGNLAGFLFPQTENGDRVVLDRYAEMAKAAYPAIKEANDDAIVTAGVTGPRGRSNDRNTGVEDWIKGMADRDVPMDGYSQHLYPVAAPTQETEAFPAWATLSRLERAVDEISPNLPIYITEAGYTTMATPYRGAAATATEAEQATYLTEIYSLRSVASGRYKTITWFNLQDNPGWPAGLITLEGRKKPSYAAFTAIPK